MFVPQKSIAIWMLAKSSDFEMDTRGWILERINLRGRKRLRDWLDKFGEMATVKHPTRKIE